MGVSIPGVGRIELPRTLRTTQEVAEFLRRYLAKDVAAEGSK